MTEEEKPVSPDQEAAPQQEQLPLEQTAAAAEIVETPAEPEVEKPAEEVKIEEPPAVAIVEEIKADNPPAGGPAFAPIAEKAMADKETKMPLSKIVGIVIVLLVVLVAIFYATRRPAADSLGNSGQTVKVSDVKEQGKVNIIEETKSDIKVLVDSNDKPIYPKVKVVVYLGNTQKNPNSADCAPTYPLEREIDQRYDSNMINTMIGLLEPLSATEKEQGYVSVIPNGTYLKYLKLDDSGVMSVNLSGNISKSAGSCAVTAIKAQIKDTISQFASVKSVVICVDGNCNESQILQP